MADLGQSEDWLLRWARDVLRHRKGDWRPCVVCGELIECEPGYPRDVQVACWSCIKDAANA
jgi:hypothetical protein